jgi:hypothetical protein
MFFKRQYEIILTKIKTKELYDGDSSMRHQLGEMKCARVAHQTATRN